MNAVTFGAWPAEGPVGTSGNVGYTDDDATRAQDAATYGGMSTVPLAGPKGPLGAPEVKPIVGNPFTITPAIAPGTKVDVKDNTSNSGGSSSSKSNSNTPSTSKQSKVEKSTKTENVGGKYTKTTEVRPGKGPGQSRAEYTRYKNQEGKTIRSHKDSYDRGNKFQGRKPTTGDPEKRRPQ